MQLALKPCLSRREAQSFLQDGVVHKGVVGYLERSLWQIKDGRCWQGLEDGGVCQRSTKWWYLELMGKGSWVSVIR